MEAFEEQPLELSSGDLRIASGGWHGSVTGVINGKMIKLAGTITGCGLLQIHGILELLGTTTKTEFIEGLCTMIKSSDKTFDAGSIIATLGEIYYNKEHLLLEYGFVKISEYINFRHGNSYMQRLYILNLGKRLNSIM